MRVVVLTNSGNFGKTLKAYCEPSGIGITECADLTGPAAALARVADALILHCTYVDGTTIALIENALRLGYREVFVISTEEVRPEWHERAYLTGASVITTEPIRASLLVAQLKRVTSRSLPLAAATASHTASSSSPFATESTPPAELASTRTMVRLLRHAHSADSFTDAFLQHLCDQIAVSRLALYLTSPDPFTRELTCIFATGVDAETFKHVALSLDRGIGSFLRQHGIVLSIGGPVAIDAQAGYEMNALGANVAVPVSDRSTLVGVLLLGRHITGEALRKDEIEVIFHLMSDMGLVLRNARLNQNLSEERAFFASVLDQIGVGSMVIDAQLRVLHANRRSAEAIEHHQSVPIRFEHLPQPLATAVYEVIQHGAAAAKTVTLQTARHETFRASIEPFRLSSATSAAVLVLTQNFTDIEAARTLSIRNEREDLLGRMGAQFAHVVRNSLTQVSMLTQLLPTNHKDPKFIAELSAHMPRELHRLLHSADQLEWLKRIPARTVGVDLRERFDAMWNSAHELAEAKPGSTLRLQIEPTMVCCDPEALDRILFEVLLNAIQAAPSGNVDVTADEPATDSIAVHVHDDGGGFTDEALQRATEPFYSTKTSGIGLGLTVVDRLIQLESGKLILSASRRLRGADVALVLPTHRP